MPGNRGRQRLGQSPRCNGEDPTGEDGTGDPIEDGLTEGMQGAGVTNFNSDHIGVRVDHPGTYWRFSIRLDANGCLDIDGEKFFDWVKHFFSADSRLQACPLKAFHAGAQAAAKQPAAQPA